VPALAVGDDVQQPLGVGHVVGVAGGDGFPRVAGRVSGRESEGCDQPVAPVGAVVGESLAGPFAGDQDAAPGVAEVFAAVSFALAVPGAQSQPRILGLNAVTEPVGARRGTRLVAQRIGQLSGVVVLGGCSGSLAVSDVLGQVLGEVADAPVDVT
jgi:hypothetical protein